MNAPPFSLIMPETDARWGLVFLCDHAANAVPPEYGTLGLDETLFQSHIAYDIGAAVLTRALAAQFNAPAVLAGYSRLVIDVNRGADDPTLIMKLSDGHIVPGNAAVDARETAHRLEAFHAPYHRAIEEVLMGLHKRGQTPIIVSLHSFTPVWKGSRRIWDVGVLWDKDKRLATPLMTRLKAAGFTVGDNEPYSGELENDCLYVHGTMQGFPHVLIEVRQDLIGEETAAKSFAARLAPILEASLADMASADIRFTRPLAQGDITMDEKTRERLEAATFRRLVAHLRNRTDVQNIDLMITAGFCRNCLGDWYREAAAEMGMPLEQDAARGLIYGMSPAEWKTRYQKKASPEQLAAFEKSQKTHS